MTHYDTASQIAHRLGPWASPDGAQPMRSHEIEAALAAERQRLVTVKQTKRGGWMKRAFAALLQRRRQEPELGASSPARPSGDTCL